MFHIIFLTLDKAVIFPCNGVNQFLLHWIGMKMIIRKQLKQLGYLAHTYHILIYVYLYVYIYTYICILNTYLYLTQGKSSEILIIIIVSCFIVSYCFKNNIEITNIFIFVITDRKRKIGTLEFQRHNPFETDFWRPSLYSSVFCKLAFDMTNASQMYCLL